MVGFSTVQVNFVCALNLPGLVTLFTVRTNSPERGDRAIAKGLYLVNPRSELPGYYGAEVFEQWGFAPTVGIADLATATVAALAPPDWPVAICEEHVGPIDFDTDAPFVGITGKITQAGRMIEVADEFRRRGKTVICGGPYASLSPDRLRPHCDILLIGEMEAIAGQFFQDLERGCWAAEYRPERPDLDGSPIPRWDLYPNDRAMVGCVQTSRGCPFECEFCDVIPYLGRRQRHKPTAPVLAELDQLYALGYRNVFLADDNFTVYRRRAKELLESLAEWNAGHGEGPVSFITQVSVDAARDPELVRLCAEAGLYGVFVGIETPNEESLVECKKRQNTGLDLVAELQVFLDHGISVTAGMIVGFDHDGPDIFRRQHAFAASAPVPIFTLGALVAPVATPLYQRLQAEDRLIEGRSEVAGTPWDTNIVNALLSREQLLSGMRWLCRELYSAEAFGQRMLTMIERLAPHPLDLRAAARGHGLRGVEADTVLLIKTIGDLGAAERGMLRVVLRAMRARPHTAGAVMTSLFRYAQIRHLYEVGACFERAA
jgi:hypothetical protein